MTTPTREQVIERSRIDFECYFLESRKSKGANRAPTFQRYEHDGTYIEDHAPEDDDYDDYEPPPPPRSSTGHEWDDDAVCIHCGFDGAEWHHWKHHTYEGKAQPEAKPPLCTRRA